MISSVEEMLGNFLLTQRAFVEVELFNSVQLLLTETYNFQNTTSCRSFRSFLFNFHNCLSTFIMELCPPDRVAKIRAEIQSEFDENARRIESNTLDLDEQ